MKDERIINVDILRGLSVLLIIAYHSWVYAGYPILIKIGSIIAYGGEIGVTMFFILSGFSVYLSINKDYNIGYKHYLKKRVVRICPGYYISIIIIILFQKLATLLTKNGLLDVITHGLFIHNLFPQYHGSINGVYWTLGNIIQFYFLSWIFYKLLKKYNFKIVILSIFLTICYKLVCYSLLSSKNIDEIFYFIYGRQLLGSIDNFILGMYISHMYINNKKYFLKYKYIIVVLLIFALFYWVKLLDINKLYINTIFGCIWHTVLACLLSLILYYVINLKNFNNIINKVILYISKFEYELYLWHIIILIQLTNIGFRENKFLYIYVLTLIITILWSIMYKYMINNLISNIVAKNKDKNRLEI